MGDGTQIHFCENTWFDELPLKLQSPERFRIIKTRNVLISLIVD